MRESVCIRWKLGAGLADNDIGSAAREHCARFVGPADES